MKQAYIPRIERGAHTLSEFTPILREQGEVLYIDTLNWRADFPHRPLVAAYLGYDAKHSTSPTSSMVKTSARSPLEMGTMSTKTAASSSSCSAKLARPILTLSSMLLGYATQHTTSLPPKLSFSAQKSSPALSAGRLISESTGLELTGAHAWEVTVAIPWTTMGYEAGKLPTLTAC